MNVINLTELKWKTNNTRKKEKKKKKKPGCMHYFLDQMFVNAEGWKFLLVRLEKVVEPLRMNSRKRSAKLAGSSEKWSRKGKFDRVKWRSDPLHTNSKLTLSPSKHHHTSWLISKWPNWNLTEAAHSHFLHIFLTPRATPDFGTTSCLISNLLIVFFFYVPLTGNQFFVVSVHIENNRHD